MKAIAILIIILVLAISFISTNKEQAQSIQDKLEQQSQKLDETIKQKQDVMIENQKLLKELENNGQKVTDLEQELTWRQPYYDKYGEQVVNAVVASFGHDDYAFKIMQCESGGNPEATNLNTNGTSDSGLFQINSIHAGRYDMSNIFDPYINAQIAKSIKDSWGSWSPWVCSRRV